MSQATTMTTPIDDANGRTIARKPKTMSRIAHTIDLPEPRLKSPACAMLPPMTTAYRDGASSLNLTGLPYPLLVHYGGNRLGTVSSYRWGRFVVAGQRAGFCESAEAPSPRALLCCVDQFTFTTSSGFQV